jgi:hypothetical protein
MPTWNKDLRLALRMLRRRPGFTTVVFLTLALGIGCTTGLFGVFRTVFLEPLPLPDSGRLTFVMEQGGFGLLRAGFRSRLHGLGPAPAGLCGDGHPQSWERDPDRRR